MYTQRYVCWGRKEDDLSSATESHGKVNKGNTQQKVVL